MYINQASEIAYEYIVQEIRSGTWGPGDKIATESKLENLIGVSRIAIRQSIERLVALSVLYKVQGSGTYVEKIENRSIMCAGIFGCDDNFMMKVMEFRKMFDSYNMELFIKYGTEEEIRKLEHNFEEMKAVKNDMQVFYKMDQLFHDIIANGTKNPLIIQISRLFVDLLTDNQKSIYHNVGPDNAIKFHGKILEAIKEKNAAVASIYARMSIEESIKKLEALNEQNSG